MRVVLGLALVGLVALVAAMAGPAPDASAPPRDASLPDAVPADASAPGRVLKLTSFAPKRANLGDPVTLTGDGFGSTTKVTHGGVLFPVKERMPATLIVTVPVGAKGTHRLVVSNRDKQVESAETLEVIPPTAPKRPPGTPKPDAVS